MSLLENNNDLTRISIYDFNISNIELSSLDIQLKHHTGYNEEHLKRLKYLFQQITGPEKNTLDIVQFEFIAKSLCHTLTKSNEAHHLAEILFKAYDKNANNLIDFHEMVEFVWTVVDAPREEQIVSLYQVFEESNGKISRNHLHEFLILLKDDFQMNISDRTKSLNTDEEIRNRINECFQYYHNSFDGLNLIEIIDYFLGSNHTLSLEVNKRWNSRLERQKKKQQQHSSMKIRLKDKLSKSQTVR